MKKQIKITANVNVLDTTRFFFGHSQSTDPVA